jgi:squalene monooxygenase
MVVIDQHVLWTFFASLFGFVLLYTLRRNNNSNGNKIKTKKMTFPQECAKESFPDGECRPVNGSGTDVIIVGAGVAGSALAYTLGKVSFAFKFFFFFF